MASTSLSIPMVNTTSKRIEEHCPPAAEGEDPTVETSNLVPVPLHTLPTTLHLSRTMAIQKMFSSLALFGIHAMPVYAEPVVVGVAQPQEDSTSRAHSEKITAQIFLTFQGIPPASSSTEMVQQNNASPTQKEAKQDKNTIVIGLFGNSAPQPTAILLALASKQGFRTPCKPREIRTLAKEQLEANKIYNACMEEVDSGVTYDYGTVWRVIRNVRIDIGAVSGKYLSRIPPLFTLEEEEERDMNTNPYPSKRRLKHDVEGIVSVRKGFDGGFGFTIYPGGPCQDERQKQLRQELDEDNIVVGRVIQGIDVVQRMNQVPVVQSAAYTSGLVQGWVDQRTAPSRRCRYGSAELFCSELKPLKKILIIQSGIVEGIN